MCADSMLTHTIATPTGPTVTNFEYAEKLVVLGKDVPAAAMYNGQASLFDESVAVILKRASRNVGRLQAPDNMRIYETVRDEINNVYVAKTPMIKAAFAQHWNTPDGLRQINEDRARRALPAVTVVDPARVAFQNDPSNSIDPRAYDLFVDALLTVVIAAHVGDTPLAREVMWPGMRESDVLARFGKALVWWGSGGTPVGRVMQGFDMRLLDQHVQLGVAGAAEAQQYFQSQGMAFNMPVPVAVLPLQDAIDLVEAMGEFACYYDRFRVGPPMVGGELDILVLAPDTRDWVGHKEFHSKRRRRENGENQ